MKFLLFMVLVMGNYDGESRTYEGASSSEGFIVEANSVSSEQGSEPVDKHKGSVSTTSSDPVDFSLDQWCATTDNAALGAQLCPGWVEVCPEMTALRMQHGFSDTDLRDGVSSWGAGNAANFQSCRPERVEVDDEPQVSLVDLIYEEWQQTQLPTPVITTQPKGGQTLVSIDTYQLKATIEWVGQYSIGDSGEWHTIEGTAKTTATTPIKVGEHRPRLVHPN